MEDIALEKRKGKSKHSREGILKFWALLQEIKRKEVIWLSIERLEKNLSGEGSNP